MTTNDSAPKIPLIDPTLNVKEASAMAAAASERLRQADLRYVEMVQQKDREFASAMLTAATRRSDDINAQKTAFEASAQNVLRLQVENNATLFLAQMDRGFANVAKQFADLSERISRLEQFRHETGGKGAGSASVLASVVTFISIMIAAISVGFAIFKN